MEETRAGKKKSINKNTIFIHIFIISYVIIDEIIFSMGLGLGFSIYKFLFALAGGLFMYLLGNLPKNPKRGILIQAIFLIIIDTMYISQFVYWKIFSTPYFISSLSGTGAAMEFIGVAVNNFFGQWYVSMLFVLHVIMFFTLYRIAFKKWKKPNKIVRNSLIAWIVSVAVCTGIPLATTGINSPSYLMLYEHIPLTSAKTFGMLPSMLLDAKYNLFKIDMQYNVDEEISMGNISISESEEKPQPTAQPIKPINEIKAPKPEYKPNIMDINFNMEESDEELLELNKYFSKREPTKQNEYSGLFKGKNLILITAEGFSGAVIDKELTPTLYKLSQEGFIFNNFYTPIWGVSTSDGEYVATTGLVPKTGVWSYTKIANNYMPFAFGNQFAKEGIVPLAFHNHSYTYYNRDKSYPAMGYTYYAKNHGLEVTDQWPESDVEMMDLSVPMYVNDDKFHIYYLTVSGHLEYNFSGNTMALKHKEEVMHLDNSEAVKAYKACQLELEYALENLIAQLDAAGQLDNTVIALSADHYPYGLTNDEYAELMGVDELETTFQMYQNDFLLWTPSMKEGVVVDKYCSSLDIAPTLSNLFGLQYDSRLYMGRDIFSDMPPIVVFQDRSFITDKIKYDAEKNNAQMISTENVDEEYIESMASEVSKMFKYSASIIDNDYYKYLFSMDGQQNP